MFLWHSDFDEILGTSGTDEQTGWMQFFIAPIQLVYFDFAETSSLLVLRAVRRQRYAIYVILAMFECCLYKYGKYLVRQKIEVII